MLYRVVMDICHMVCIIPFVANPVLPIAPLPYSPFSFGDSDFRTPFGARQFLHKPDLDAFPAVGKIIIVRRQRPDRMHVVGQHHPRIDMKRAIPFGCTYRLTQFINMTYQQIQPSFEKVHGKKIRPARHPIPSIIRYITPVAPSLYFVWRMPEG